MSVLKEAARILRCTASPQLTGKHLFLSAVKYGLLQGLASFTDFVQAQRSIFAWFSVIGLSATRLSLYPFMAHIVDG